MNRCSVHKRKERLRKIKSQTEGKNILSMQMRRGKQKHMRSSWPPGPCQSSLSPFLFLSLSTSPHLATALLLPAATVQEVDRKRRREGGASSREAGETVHQQAILAMEKKKTFPFTKICLSNYHGVSRSLQTLSNI